MGWETGLYAFAVVLSAASLQGITGAGMMILSVPALVVVLPATVVVPGIVLLYLPLGVAQLIQLRRDVDRRRLAMLAVSSALMVPLGAVILRDVDAVTLQHGIGWLMIALALLLQMKPGPPFSREFAPCVGAGLIAGLLAASTSVSGPPLVLLGLKQRWEPARFRATVIAYFLIISAFSLPFYWEMDLVTPATWQFRALRTAGGCAGLLHGNVAPGKGFDSGFSLARYGRGGDRGPDGGLALRPSAHDGLRRNVGPGSPGTALTTPP